MCVVLLSVSMAKETKTKSSSKYNCAKKYCSKMSSCEEAMYKLKKCGHKKLDRDKDGVPCEKICSGG